MEGLDADHLRAVRALIIILLFGLLAHSYHYFAAKETYNVIRNLIAGYVFLTGFGNYSFFYVKGDFGYKRVVKMLFRINFLVAMISITLNRR